MDGSSYISVGYNFLQISINSIEQMIIQGNKTLVISNLEEIRNDGWAEYHEKTKWNDQNIGIPVLFNFFHGFELILKGLIVVSGGDLVNNSHRLDGLLKKLKSCSKPPHKNILDHFEKILTNNGLESFFKINNTNVNSFYELFKYPEFKNGQSIDFSSIKGLEKVGAEKYQNIKELAEGIKNEIIKWKTQ